MPEAIQEAASTAIAEYSKTQAALAQLSELYKGVVFDVTKSAGLTQARKARQEIREYRTSLEAMRVQIKAPALERCRLIDSEAKRITAALLELEQPIDRQIKNEEERKENERLAKERAEAERVAAEQRAIKEAEEKKLAEERAEIARRQAELEKAERARDELEKAARLKIEAEERAARLRIEEEERKARLEREEQDRQARKAREAEEARLKAERELVEAQARALQKQAQQKQEAEEAKQREILRQQNEILDARQMLDLFCRRFGHIAEFAPIVAVIKEHLK